MPREMSNGIGRQHILAAIQDIQNGVKHSFGRSMFYDVLYKGARYPPKAVYGLAASKVSGRSYGPHDFKGGLRTFCFRTLRENGFEIVTKADHQLFPNEIDADEEHIEGAVYQVTVNRFERDPKARAKAIAHYGARCQVCRFDFEVAFGSIGAGFIHVHHVVRLSEIRSTYVIDPVGDLRPVCPNCHAMLHKRSPPYSLEQLISILSNALSA
jgi:5-methylcytosine-specific restriction protein A